MDLDGRTLWQVGAGDTERNYSRICKWFDVMMVGPGNLGPYKQNKGKYAQLGDIRHSIRRFYEEAKGGDLVLLRIGTGHVLAVGVIVEERPMHRKDFGDVDGWKLARQHQLDLRTIDRALWTWDKLCRRGRA